MSHRLASIGLIAVLFLLVGCTSAPDDRGTRYKGDCENGPCDETPSILQWIDWQAAYDIGKVLKSARNGVHRLGRYDAKNFDAGEFAAAARVLDETRGCSNRMYSHSREDGVRLYNDFVEREDAYKELDGIDEWDAKEVRELVADESNVGVFASVWNSADSEDGEYFSCWYADFFVLMSNGTAVHLYFDFREEPSRSTLLDGPESIGYVTPSDAKHIYRWQDYGGNGGSAIGRFDQKSLETDALVAEIRENDKQSGTCTNPDRISVGSTDVVAEFDRFVKDENLSPFQGYWSESLAEEIEGGAEAIAADEARTRELLLDPTNVAVVASTFPEDNDENETGDYSESCLYFDFYILRADGTAMRMTVNHTD